MDELLWNVASGRCEDGDCYARCNSVQFFVFLPLDRAELAESVTCRNPLERRSCAESPVAARLYGARFDGIARPTYSLDASLGYHLAHSLLYTPHASRLFDALATAAAAAPSTSMREHTT